ncbi:MAG TPA: tyrosine--tRNA ligase [Candidatus Thermoplasmatota archaeon]|nr:tyrosine--tRNA ligase [Candidatus Thermoplasmatota archaeon]
MDAEAAYRLVRGIAAEAVGEDELKALCQDAALGKRPKAYIGFEPSGTAHVGWMVCTDAIRRVAEAGFDVTVLLADWHAQINDKLGGDLAAIQRCGKYMEEAFEALGVVPNTVTYRYANEFAKDPGYWALVVKVMHGTTLARMRRAMTIMGRKEEEGDADMSKFLYPAMQVADIFHMGIRLAMGGMDQRHAHMLARDVAPKLGFAAPVALHTPLVPGLKAGAGRMDPVEAKMSKSDPDSGIFIHDSREDIVRKLKGAHCPAREVDGNPVLDLLRLVVFPRISAASGALRVNRPEKFGGNKAYPSYEGVAADFAAGALHPMDLKAAVADALDQELQSVRAYFAKHPDNWQFVQGLRKTR